jgi:cobalt-zinc-cadmium efflux system outer membrane protein
MRIRSHVASVVLAGACQAVAASAQSSSIDSLVARAIVASPVLHIAAARVDASRARVGPAGSLPDPMLMLGIINQPLGRSAMPADGPEPMTMRMVGVSQSLPYPGKRALLQRSAAYDVESAEASLDADRRQVVRDTKVAAYEIAFLDHALALVERNRGVLANLITLTESRYSVGAASQQDILKSRVEATRLGQTASDLFERRHAALAALNAIIDRPSETPVPSLAVPDAIARAAVGATNDDIHFVSASLGARSADSPLKPLTELQDEAVRDSPAIRAHLATLAAQSARADLARKSVLPDVDLSLQYGQRGGGLPDMISATIAVPLPIFRRTKQDQQVVEATAQLAVLEGEHHLMVNTIRADVARLVSDVERQRTTLALTVKAILPQSRASLTSATASYQVGKVEFRTVLENQSALFGVETEYFRALSDFATSVAELERIVGREVLK